MWPHNRDFNHKELQMLSLFVDEHNRCSRDNQKETIKQHTCICNAILESKSSCLSSLIKVKLLHTLYDGYLNHIRQALSALPKV